MMCDKCKVDMVYFREMPHQGLKCPICGEIGVVATWFDELHSDDTEYSIFIKKVTGADVAKIRMISKIAAVNYLTAKQMLEKGDICILKERAVEIKEAISKLREADIPFEVTPEFKHSI